MQWLSYQRHTMTLKIIRFLLSIITTQLGVIISTCSSQKPNTLNFGEKKPYRSHQEYIGDWVQCFNIKWGILLRQGVPRSYKLYYLESLRGWHGLSVLLALALCKKAVILDWAHTFRRRRGTGAHFQLVSPKNSGNWGLYKHTCIYVRHCAKCQWEWTTEYVHLRSPDSRVWPLGQQHTYYLGAY